MSEITASLFGDMLPDALKQQTTQGYAPEYFNQVQNYYQGYLPGQSLDTQALQDWYGNSSQVNYGGNTYAPPAASSAASGLFGKNLSSGAGEQSSGDSSSGSGFGDLDATGLANGSAISSGQVQALASVLGLFGLPTSTIATLLGPQNIANALNSQSYSKALSYNLSLVGQQLGLDPNDPANIGALSSAIDSLSAVNTGTTAATAGLAGTGGSAAQAASQVAQSAIAAGFSPETAAQMAQTAANAVMGGKSVNEAVASAASNLGVNTSAPADNSQSYGGGDSTSSSSADSTAADNSGVGGW